MSNKLENLYEKFERRRIDKGLVFGLIAILFTLVFTLHFKMQYDRPVTFNARKTLTLFMEQAGKKQLSQKITADQMKRLSARFAQALQGATQQYAARHHVVILVNEAVVAGAQDVTPQIWSLISQEMTKDSDSDSDSQTANKPVMTTTSN